MPPACGRKATLRESACNLQPSSMLKTLKSFYSVGFSVGLHNYSNPVSEEEAIEVIERAQELGAGFLDTSDVYGNGHNEQLTCEFDQSRSTPFPVPRLTLRPRCLAAVCPSYLLSHKPVRTDRLWYAVPAARVLQGGNRAKYTVGTKFANALKDGVLLPKPLSELLVC